MDLFVRQALPIEERWEEKMVIRSPLRSELELADRRDVVTFSVRTVESLAGGLPFGVMVDCSSTNLEDPGVFADVHAQEEYQSARTPMYLVYTPKVESNFCWKSTWSSYAEFHLLYVSIPDHVQVLCDECFKGCWNLRRVTFGPSSSLERIGVEAFGAMQEGWHTTAVCGLVEINIPDGVEALPDRCFCGCANLLRVTFGPSSSLERIGVEAFGGIRDGSGKPITCGLIEIMIPNSVLELCDRCFKGSSSLRHVVFGSASCLERIGVEAFGPMTDLWGNPIPCGLVEISIPDSVCELCDRCFCGCPNLLCVTISPFSSLERIGAEWIRGTQVKEVSIPNSVGELCDRCFKGCSSLRRVIFGSLSSLERFGVSCFEGTGLEEVRIPDGVRELCDRCFCLCTGLRRVIFGSSSSLQRIGVEAFGAMVDRWGNSTPCGLVEISIPDSVCELCDQCFFGCSNLRWVTFGSLSSLEKIGTQCFACSGLEKFEIPDSVRWIGGAAFRECLKNGNILCSDLCSLRAVGGLVLSDDFTRCCCSYTPGYRTLHIPRYVRELCDGCFKGSRHLSVEFEDSSSLQRMGISCFAWASVKFVSIPASVRELCDRCFYKCKNLREVKFSPVSSLVRIGVSCFEGSELESVIIPASVREIGDRCFYKCKYLLEVKFSPASSLERIGFHAIPFKASHALWMRNLICGPWNS